MSRTTSPCPGCGEVHPSRAAADVCDNCRHAITQWKKHTDALKQQATHVPVALIEASHWYPMFYGPRHGHDPDLNDLRDLLAKLFWKLPGLVCNAELPWRDAHAEDVLLLYQKKPGRVPDPEARNGTRYVYYPTSDGNGLMYSAPIGYMHAEVFEILDALHDASVRFAQLAYLNGVRHGRELLHQLASGEITAAEFNEQDIQLAQSTQDQRLLHRELKKRKGTEAKRQRKRRKER